MPMGLDSSLRWNDGKGRWNDGKGRWDDGKEGMTEGSGKDDLFLLILVFNFYSANKSFDVPLSSIDYLFLVCCDAS